MLLPSVALGARLAGVVRDLAGRPLGGLTLEALRDGERVARQRVGPKGEYAFELPPGRYVLRARGPALCEEGRWHLETRADEDLAEAVRFARCVRVTGRVVGLDGAPLARGQVTLRWTRAERPELTVKTDAKGRFVFARAAQGPIEVGLRDATGLELKARARWSAPRVLEVRAERALQAVVRGPGGEPLVDALVALVPEPLNEANLGRQTDARGRAGFAVGPGRYRLLAFWKGADAFERYLWEDVELAAGAEAPVVELRFAPPPPGTLTGRVLDAQGRPVGNARVEAVQRFSSLPLEDDFLRNTAYPREKASTRADEEGRFTLGHLREGEYTLRVDHEEGRMEALARTGGPPVEVRLGGRRCASTATGRVIDEEGAPVRDFELGPERFQDEQGRFKLEGACVIIIRAEDFLPKQVPLPRPVPEHVELGDIVLRRGRSLAGRVVRLDGTPVADLGLWVDSLEARTDASGRFTVKPVSREGLVVVRLEDDGLTLLRRVRPEEDRELTLRVPLGGSRLEVRAFGVEGSPAVGVEVTAEGAWGSMRVSTNREGHAVLSLPPGPHELRAEQARWRRRHRGIPARFATRTVQVPQEGTLPLELRPTRGTGKLRVLLPRPTHYDEVHVVPGVHPWPTDGESWGRILDRELVADEKTDLRARRGGSLIYYEVLNDFSDLEPGPYTVFTTNAYDDDDGMTLFPQVIEVSGQGRQVVQVRFEGETTRVLR